MAEKKAIRSAYGKLSKPNKQLIDAIKGKEKHRTLTIAEIAMSYQKATGQSVTTEMLLQKLLELEETGLVHHLIASRKDEPTDSWSTRI